MILMEDRKCLEPRVVLYKMALISDEKQRGLLTQDCYGFGVLNLVFEKIVHGGAGDFHLA